MTKPIQIGWSLKTETIIAKEQPCPFYDGPPHHIEIQHRYRGGEVATWKRWRYRAELNTLFWWEPPTAEEKECTENALAEHRCCVERHIFVQLRTTKGEPLPGTYAANLEELEANARDPGILDATHYLDHDLTAVRNWLHTVGD